MSFEYHPTEDRVAVECMKRFSRHVESYFENRYTRHVDLMGVMEDEAPVIVDRLRKTNHPKADAIAALYQECKLGCRPLHFYEQARRIVHFEYDNELPEGGARV